MSITATTPTTSANSSSGAPATAYAALGPDSFLTLLIAELQTQDPLSPMDTQSMVAQLSTMEMVSESRASRQSQEFVQALGMMDRTVSWQDSTTKAISSGQVTGVARDGSEARLVVNGGLVSLADVQTVL